MMNPQASPVLRQGMNLGFHIVTNTGTVLQNHGKKSPKEKDNNSERMQLLRAWLCHSNMA
jgi:hypothetical protein